MMSDTEDAKVCEKTFGKFYIKDFNYDYGELNGRYSTFFSGTERIAVNEKKLITCKVVTMNKGEECLQIVNIGKQYLSDTEVIDEMKYRK